MPSKVEKLLRILESVRKCVYFCVCVNVYTTFELQIGGLVLNAYATEQNNKCFLSFSYIYVVSLSSVSFFFLFFFEFGE